LIFNGHVWSDVWSFAGATQIGIDDRDVTAYLNATANEAGFQSSEDYMEASNAILVVESNVTKTFEIPLVVGWNLISIPMEIDNSSINAVFPDANDGDMIYAYGSGVWYISTYYSDYGVWDGDVMTIQPDKGYWYIANSAYTAIITGREAGPRSVPINTGWNLIGYTRLSEANLTDLITEEDGCSDGDMIYAYGNGVWYISTYYGDYGVWDGDITVMEPGKGYWYLAKALFTWEY